MPIRKYGNEPARTEVLEADNDPETLKAVQKEAQEKPDSENKKDQKKI